MRPDELDIEQLEHEARLLRDLPEVRPSDACLREIHTAVSTEARRWRHDASRATRHRHWRPWFAAAAVVILAVGLTWVFPQPTAAPSSNGTRVMARLDDWLAAYDASEDSLYAQLVGVDPEDLEYDIDELLEIEALLFDDDPDSAEEPV